MSGFKKFKMEDGALISDDSESEISEQEYLEEEQEEESIVVSPEAYSLLFFEMCRNNDVDNLNLLLQKPNLSEEIINFENEDGFTGFSAACGLGNLNVVRRLLEDERVEVNVIGYQNMTPFFGAIIRDQYEVARELICNPRVDIFLGDGEDTPFTQALMNALDGDNSNILKLFLNDSRISLAEQIGFENIEINLITNSKRMDVTFNPTPPNLAEVQEVQQQPVTLSIDLGVDENLNPKEAGFLLNARNRDYLTQHCVVRVDGVELQEQPKNCFFNREVFSDLFGSFLHDEAAKTLAPAVLLSDEYLKLKENILNPTNSERFLNILSKLPLEMQSGISHVRAASEEKLPPSKATSIKVKSFEKAVKKVFKDYEGQGGSQI